MSDPFEIPGGETRRVWVFAFDGPLDELDALTPAALAEALGLWSAPKVEAMERFDLSHLEDYGFARYLSEANGMALGNDTAMLNALTGPVLVVFSQGLAEAERRFDPDAPFRLIGRYGLTTDLTLPEDITSESALGQLPEGKAPMSSARMSGMVATVVLLFLAVFVAAFVWVGK